jgi:hypothetical protein
MTTSSVCFRLPAAPTGALPGSVEKIRILAERARLRVSLWHPLDARLPSDACTARLGGIAGATAIDSEALADLCLAS